MRGLVLLLLAPLAAEAQIQLTLVAGGQRKQLVSGDTYSLGQIAAGASYNFVVQAQNQGSAPVACNPAGAGTGYSINSPCADSQTTLAPGGSVNIFFTFQSNTAGSFSTSFSFGETGPVYFVITVVAAATLTASPPCTGPDSTATVSFGETASGETVTCKLQLTNQSPQTLTVSSVTIAGTGFRLSQPPATPLTLTSGQSSTFVVTFSPNSAAVDAGSLTVDSQTYPLTGVGLTPPLPAFAIGFDTNAPQSGQQVTLSLTLPTSSPITASGYVTLSFQADPSVANAANPDPNIVFTATGATTAGFTIQQGSTQAMFGNQPGAVFQTGTTAGTMTFTVTLNSGAQFSGPAPMQTIKLSPMPVYLDGDTASAIAVAGALRISMSGFDNTYSAGPMSFTFRDNVGNAIGTGAVTADFTSSFHSYFFTQSVDGGSFAMLLTFQVTGNAAAVGSVDIQITNSAGTTTVTNLIFLNDTGTCVLVGTALSCPAAPTQ
jgi:hypothetical protein